jgi:hypothetical protein
MMAQVSMLALVMMREVQDNGVQDQRTCHLHATQSSFGRQDLATAVQCTYAMLLPTK